MIAKVEHHAGEPPDEAGHAPAPALALDEMRKRLRARHSGLYSAAAGKGEREAKENRLFYICGRSCSWNSNAGARRARAAHLLRWYL